MTTVLHGFTPTEAAYQRAEDEGLWSIERKAYAKQDGAASSRFYWQVTARARTGSICATLHFDPFAHAAIRSHIECAPPLSAGPKPCASWFSRLAGLAGEETFVTDDWWLTVLRKSEATAEQCARRIRFIEALQSTGWSVDPNVLANFDDGIGQSPDVKAARDGNEVWYFTTAHVVEGHVGGLLLRMLEPSDVEGSLRSLEPLVRLGSKGVLEWIQLARPLHHACLLSGPEPGGWTALDLPPS